MTEVWLGPSGEVYINGHRVHDVTSVDYSRSHGVDELTLVILKPQFLVGEEAEAKIATQGQVTAVRPRAQSSAAGVARPVAKKGPAPTINMPMSAYDDKDTGP